MTKQALQPVIVEATEDEIQLMVAHAKRTGVTLSELMRRCTLDFLTTMSDENLAALLDKAVASIDRTSASFDALVTYVDASDQRIAAMDAQARQARQSA